MRSQRQNQQQFEIVAEVQAHVLEALTFLVEEAFQGQLDGVHEENELSCRRILPEAHGVAQEEARVDMQLDRFGVLDSRVHC